MRSILLGLLMMTAAIAAAQITNISVSQVYTGDSLQTTITSSGLFMTGSSPQGNIQNIILKNATDSVFAHSDSTNVVNSNTANTFWTIPSNLATGLYTLVVRIYNSLFSGPTTDYTLTNAVTVTTPVWPGDADNNHLVDNTDLLPIGLGYGSSGTTRPSANIVWHPQASIDWSRVFSSYSPVLNYKYADCNGDGIINAADTAAIIQNFSLTHAKTGGSIEQWRSGAPIIRPLFSIDTLHTGDILRVDFVLGDSNISANHIYGLAFTYNFDAIVVDSSLTAVTWTNSWLGSSADKINIGKTSGGQGQMKIAMTRIDHTSRSGSGTIGYASFKITTDNLSGTIQGPKYTNIGFISDVRVIDTAGILIPVNAGIDSNKIFVYPNGISEIDQKNIRIVPNPATSRIMVSAAQNITEVNMMDVDGEVIFSNINIGRKSLNIDISTYADGLYLVRVKTEEGAKIFKLLIAR